MPLDRAGRSLFATSAVRVVLFMAGLLGGVGAGWWTGTQAKATTATPAPPGPPIVAPVRPAPRPVRPPPAEPTTAAPEQDCPAPEEQCAYRMYTAGCTPLATPEDFEGRYDPASVQSWAEELSASCERFRSEIVRVDCSDYPCLLLVRSATEVEVEHEGLALMQGDQGLLDRITCGANTALELTPAGANREEPVDFLAVWPEDAWTTELQRRLWNRMDTYSDEDLAALLANSPP